MQNKSNKIITAEIPNNALSTLFSYLVGRPDSKVKMFFDPVQIKPEDIIELNREIVEKLSHYDIQAVETTVEIYYGNNVVEQYGVWDSFVSNNWKSDKETKSINVKWDFLIKLPHNETPIHHAILIKIASQLAPLHMMRAIFSLDPNELDKFEFEAAPIICRVDFINNLLADELLHLVEKWVSALIKPIYNLPLKHTMEKYKKQIEWIIHYSLPTTYVLVLAGLLNKLSNSFGFDLELTPTTMKYFMGWILLSYTTMFVALKLGELFSDMTIELIDRYGAHIPINFTNGDQNKINKIIEQSNNSIGKIIINAIFILFLNVLSTFLSVKLFGL